MKRFFQIIKKRKHKRRFGVLLMFLIAVELFCPVFCDEPAFAAERKAPSSFVQTVSENAAVTNEESAVISGYQTTEGEEICTDECLCHATAIPAVSIPLPEKSFFRGAPIAFLITAPYTNSLSPPHQPPKIS